MVSVPSLSSLHVTLSPQVPPFIPHIHAWLVWSKSWYLVTVASQTVQVPVCLLGSFESGIQLSTMWYSVTVFSEFFLQQPSAVHLKECVPSPLSLISSSISILCTYLKVPEVKLVLVIGTLYLSLSCGFIPEEFSMNMLLSKSHGIFIVVKLEQPANAFIPISITLADMVTEVKLAQ